MPRKRARRPTTFMPGGTVSVQKALSDKHRSRIKKALPDGIDPEPVLEQVAWILGELEVDVERERDVRAAESQLQKLDEARKRFFDRLSSLNSVAQGLLLFPERSR